jgi:hypothetical protein
MTLRLNDLPMSEDTRRRNADLLQREGTRPVEYRARPERLLKQYDLDGFDSQLERDFDTELRARGYEVRPHGWTFHLPGGVDYTPDFIAWHTPQTRFQSLSFVGCRTVCVYEVKGDHVKNTRDSRTRFKIAAGLYPACEFYWVTRTPAGKWIEKIYRGQS